MPCAYALVGVSGTRRYSESQQCTTVVQVAYSKDMQVRRKSAVRRSASVRQSVRIPAHPAREVRRVAKERNVTMSRALVTLAERGVAAEAATPAPIASRLPMRGASAHVGSSLPYPLEHRSSQSDVSYTNKSTGTRNRSASCLACVLLMPRFPLRISDTRLFGKTLQRSLGFMPLSFSK